VTISETISEIETPSLEDSMPAINPEPKSVPVKDLEPDKTPVNIDPDDAQIEEPNDDAVGKSGKPRKHPSRERDTAPTTFFRAARDVNVVQRVGSNGA
jgi:hypothetical protein